MNKFNMPAFMIENLNKQKVTFYDKDIENIINIEIKESRECSGWVYMNIFYMDSKENMEIKNVFGQSYGFKAEERSDSNE